MLSVLHFKMCSGIQEFYVLHKLGSASKESQGPDEDCLHINISKFKLNQYSSMTLLAYSLSQVGLRVTDSTGGAGEDHSVHCRLAVVTDTKLSEKPF